MLCILCSGQGEQQADLFARVWDDAGAAVLATAVRERWMADDVTAWLQAKTPDPALLHLDRFAQPLLCLYQQAVWATLAPRLGRVSLFAGLSLGQLSAVSCAGALTAADVVGLASQRAELMDAVAPPGRLIAVLGLDADAVAAVCAATGAAVAIQTGSTHWTLGCLAGACDAVVQAALAHGASLARPLGVSVASHTHWLTPAAEPFRSALEAANFQRSHAPVLAGRTGQRLWTPAQMIPELCAELHESLRWDLCVEAALTSGVRTFLELGPGTTLVRTILARDSSVAARSVVEFDTLEAAAAWASQPG